ncbi:MAG: sulfite exporter TauE/SafE family protein [Chitinophagaceae bacterium]|nr:sulfite exporter TauE/SafE family protein [Chitinophagaceae bacterium]
MWQALIAGGSLGLLSSFHCVGMCGPLALSLPVQHFSRIQQIIALLLYNMGRVVTYSLLGLIFGITGRQLFVAGWQQWFSIALGVFILVLALQYFFFKNLWQPSWLQNFHYKVQGWMSHFLQSRHISAFLLLGMANGLLPCGMVYIAIAGALSSSEVVHSVAFMAAFGMATLPAMFFLSWMGLRMDLGIRNRIRKVMPMVVVAIALVLILRGMNLGIPFISPVLASSPGDAINCH